MIFLLYAIHQSLVFKDCLQPHAEFECATLVFSIGKGGNGTSRLLNNLLADCQAKADSITVYCGVSLKLAELCEQF